MKDFNFQLFRVLRGSTLRFDGSPLLLLTFYSNQSGRGVLCFPLVPDYFHINSDPLGHQLGFVEKEAKNCVKEGKNISNSQD